MDKGDLFTLAGGLVVILVIAVIANPGLISVLRPGEQGTPVGQEVQETAVPTTVPTVLPSSTVPVVNQTLQPPAAPVQILYTKNPYTYPVIHLPDRMETFGGSNSPLYSNQTVTFAYVEGSGGGLTTIFTVPYEMWALNISVTANTQPQYADFRMVLCDAKTGAFITGGEIQNGGGSLYKVVRNTGPMYMIIGTNYVDSFTVSLETPYTYYAKAAGSGT